MTLCKYCCVEKYVKLFNKMASLRKFLKIINKFVLYFYAKNE